MAEKTTNGQATHPQEMLQLGAAGQSLSEQELSSPSSRTDTKRTQTHQPSEAVPVMMTQAVTPVPSVQNQESGPSTVIKGETSKSKNPQMNPWAEVLTSRTESEAGVCAIGRKPAVSKWYPKLPYPRPSWLTMQDQADYLDLLARQADARQHKPLETKEMAHFKVSMDSMFSVVYCKVRCVATLPSGITWQHIFSIVTSVFIKFLPLYPSSV